MANIAVLQSFSYIGQARKEMELPTKRIALSHPLSVVVSLRSHSADGNKKEMQMISTASLPLAQPQTKSNQ